MFHRLNEPATTVEVYLDGRPLAAAAGDTVATALLAAGVMTFGWTPPQGTPPSPSCMIGHCYRCMVEIDGMPYRQACQTIVADGMRIKRMVVA